MIPAFGRREDPDLRDRAFLMTRMLPDAATLKLPTRKTWSINSGSLDQGNTGTCVGHGWRNFLRCAPLKTEKTGPSAFDIYRAAVRVDSWSDNDDEAELPDWDPGMDSGTSVRAGAKAVASFGRLAGYVWSFQLSETIRWLKSQGPVVVGVNWYSSFMDPDAQGVVQIRPGAGVLGGHAFLIRGADSKKALVRCENSWGEGWGRSGGFYIPFGDFERLIHEGGEVCAATEQRLTNREEVVHMSEELKALHAELNATLAASGQKTLSVAEFLRALNIGMQAALAIQQLTTPGGQATLPEISIRNVIYEMTIKRKN